MFILLQYYFHITAFQNAFTLSKLQNIILYADMHSHHGPLHALYPQTQNGSDAGW